MGIKEIFLHKLGIRPKNVRTIKVLIIGEGHIENVISDILKEIFSYFKSNIENIKNDSDKFLEKRENNRFILLCNIYSNIKTNLKNFENIITLSLLNLIKQFFNVLPREENLYGVIYKKLNLIKKFQKGFQNNFKKITHGMSPDMYFIECSSKSPIDDYFKFRVLKKINEKNIIRLDPKGKSTTKKRGTNKQKRN